MRRPSQVAQAVKLKEFIASITVLRDMALAGDQIDFSLVDGAPIMMTDKIVLRACQDVLDEYEKPNHGKLGEIKPGVGKYLKRSVESKHVYLNDDRTLAIACEDDGSLKLILETKAKDLNNEKINVTWRQGGFWRCKTGFWLNTTPIMPMASSVKRLNEEKETSKLLSEKELQELRQSIDYNNTMAMLEPEHFNHISCVIDDNGYAHLYMPHVEFDFHSVIIHNILCKSYPSDKHPRLDRSLIEFNGIFIEACKLDVIYQLVKAVAAMHKARIAHQDLKPENIVCEYDPKQQRLIIKVIDFGFAKLFANNKITSAGTYQYLPYESFVKLFLEFKTSHKSTKRAVTTLEYIKLQKSKEDVEPLYALDLLLKDLSVSPERNFTLDDNEYDGKYDAWSLGITIFEIFRGELPFTIDPDWEVELQQLRTNPGKTVEDLEREKEILADQNRSLDTEAVLNLLKQTPIGKMLEINLKQRATVGEVLDFMNTSTLFATIRTLPPASTQSQNTQVVTMSEEAKEFIAAMLNLNNHDYSSIILLLDKTLAYFKSMQIYGMDRFSLRIIDIIRQLKEKVNGGSNKVDPFLLGAGEDHIFTYNPKPQRDLLKTQEET